MIKRSFIGLIDPKLEYERQAENPPGPVEIERPGTATLLIDSFLDNTKPTLINVGERVVRGQKIYLHEGSEEYVIATVTGTVSKVAPYTGDFGQQCSYIAMEVEETETFQGDFMEHKGKPTLESAADYLRWVPGRLNLDGFTGREQGIDTIIVKGMDSSLLSTTCQHLLATRVDAIKDGIAILKKITGVHKVFLTTPANLKHIPASRGIDIIEVDGPYPAANGHLVVMNALDRTVPEGKTFEQAGITFLNAESMISLSQAYQTGRIPNTKTFTLVKKDGSREMVSAVIGTPIHRVLKRFDIVANEEDRIIFNGPMTGYSTFTIHHPIQSDTDSLIIQDREEIPHVSDYPCVNCGNCVRACPANMPVNLLIRFLEARQYVEAADKYDLFSCMECGLCSYVCLSRIPIFQYIRIGMFELTQTSKAS